MEVCTNLPHVLLVTNAGTSDGANITLDADVPSYGIAFRPQECHTEDAKKKTKGIGLSPYLGLELTAKGAANANAWALKPKFEKTIYVSDILNYNIITGL